ncbi:hypothetical protein P5P86_15320 [Nocardioides sp. BP30]|uniref:hypothetical protein n=1 Tax=Nocardioides sp. BP30 TaxID=3036374 RepID=UPI0024683ACD|nr:hypothetical protein [Nocardioides sp. BP30]WGL51324.1 hypothetical protein P5P86_15320 [Nocardioides sp. BP30]
MDHTDTLLTLTGRLHPADRDLALDVCVEVIAIAPELPGDHPGRAARSAALLLLELALPDTAPAVRSELAHACERAVVIPR